MGTRADFYVYAENKLEWKGSIGWDGMPNGSPTDHGVIQARTLDDYLNAINNLKNSVDDFTDPDQGWPWPWDNSRLTDFTYVFYRDKVYACFFGGKWFDPLTSEELNFDDQANWKDFDLPFPKGFPDMKHIKNVDWGERSGLGIIKPLDK